MFEILVFIAGTLFGAFVGVAFMSLCAMAGRLDNQEGSR